ncbi:MAG: FtsQ-type POTRA domain-containing protein [Candidatus Yanofskybacteria bacterium]|nr:FtsQ-type POTRA domain-containing protein [Candidatus Yanofskybacteria bacterium]
MAVPIRTRTTTRDPIAQAHRRTVLLRIGVWSVALLIVGGAFVWVFFVSSLFAITNIAVDGAQAIGNEAVTATVGGLLDQRTLQIFQPARNILFLNTTAVGDALREHYGNIERVAVEKVYPHGLRVSVVEREPVGIWCRGDACRYYDRSGAQWGEAVPSRGPLLLLVNDERSSADDAQEVTQRLLAATDGLIALGIRPRWATLPDSAPGDMRIATDRSFELYMDASGDIADQLSTLGVLLSERATDAAWAPRYIDLRTAGRVYYK